MEIVIFIALIVLGLALAFCAVRAFYGPSLFDRVLAFDCITLNITGAILLLSLWFNTEMLLDLVLVVALLGFLSTTALAVYLEGSLVD